MRIDGRTFIISGGASGLGAATAAAICTRGGNVALFDISTDNGEAVVAQLTKNSNTTSSTSNSNSSGNSSGNGNGTARFWQTDVSDSNSIATSVASAAAWASETGKKLGGVVAAAGVATMGLVVDRSLRPMELDPVDFVMAVNVRGTLDLVRQTAPLLARQASSSAGSPQSASSSSHTAQKERAKVGASGAGVGVNGVLSQQMFADTDESDSGVMVLVTSVAAFEGQMGQSAYAASKGAVASMTLPLARDLSRFGIRVCAIAPGMFDSAMTVGMSEKVRKSIERSMEFPRRTGRPHEFASLAVECITNVMLNGVVLRLDGAMRMPSRL